MVLYQTKKFLYHKGNDGQNKKDTPDWERIFYCHPTYKGLITKIYKVLVELGVQKILI